MAALPFKRKRADTTGTSQPALVDYAFIIKLLPALTVQQLLHRAVTKHSDIATEVVAARDRLKAVARSRVIDFDHHSKTA